MTMNIMFDSMGAQVQVQNQTLNRLTTWTNALTAAYGTPPNYTKWQDPISPQLQGNGSSTMQDVFIVTTHQYTSVPGNSQPPPIKKNQIPKGTPFAYASTDLGGVLNWVLAGGGLLLFVNHSDFPGQQDYPYWPVDDSVLLATLGITTVFAAIGLQGSVMTPNPQAPSEIVGDIHRIEALDSGGIVVNNGPVLLPNITSSTVLVPLPNGWTDSSPLKYHDANLAFSALYSVGRGSVIVIGHSGITGNAGTDWPSPGQIGVADNLKFLMNCVAYLGQGSQAAKISA